MWRLLTITSVLFAAGCNLGEDIACDCAMPPARTFVAPARGAVGVPPNARIWLGMREIGVDYAGQEPATTLVVEKAGGGAVEFTRTQVGLSDSYVVVLTPKAPLEAGAQYEVRVGDLVVTTFDVGGEADTVPPPVPEATGLRRSSSDIAGDQFMCGGADFFEFRMDFADAVVAVVNVGGTAKLVPADPSGDPVLATENPVHIGASACSGTTWPGAAPGATTTFALGAFDLAGNFSGWSEADPVTLPTRIFGGCTSATPAGLALLALLLVVRRRRHA